MNIKQMRDGTWFGGLLENILDTLTPNADEIRVDGTPPEMTRKAARAAFLISTGASIPTGPMGLATIIPELISLTKIQISLIYKVAKFYNHEAKVNQPIILAVFGSAMGVVLKHVISSEVGSRVIVKTLGSEGTQKITREIGEKIGAGLLRRGFGRWLPLLLAPVFGYFSLSLTRRIGQEAEKLFRQEIEMQVPYKGPLTEAAT